MTAGLDTAVQQHAPGLDRLQQQPASDAGRPAHQAESMSKTSPSQLQQSSEPSITVPAQPDSATPAAVAPADISLQRLAIADAEQGGAGNHASVAATFAPTHPSKASTAQRQTATGMRPGSAPCRAQHAAGLAAASASPKVAQAPADGSAPAAPRFAASLAAFLINSSSGARPGVEALADGWQQQGRPQAISPPSLSGVNSQLPDRLCSDEVAVQPLRTASIDAPVCGHVQQASQHQLPAPQDMQVHVSQSIADSQAMQAAQTAAERLDFDTGAGVVQGRQHQRQCDRHASPTNGNTGLVSEQTAGSTQPDPSPEDRA